MPLCRVSLTAQYFCLFSSSRCDQTHRKDVQFNVTANSLPVPSKHFVGRQERGQRAGTFKLVRKDQSESWRGADKALARPVPAQMQFGAAPHSKGAPNRFSEARMRKSTAGEDGEGERASRAWKMRGEGRDMEEGQGGARSREWGGVECVLEWE